MARPLCLASQQPNLLSARDEGESKSEKQTCMFRRSPKVSLESYVGGIYTVLDLAPWMMRKGCSFSTADMISACSLSYDVPIPQETWKKTHLGSMVMWDWQSWGPVEPCGVPHLFIVLERAASNIDTLVSQILRPSKQVMRVLRRSMCLQDERHS